QAPHIVIEFLSPGTQVEDLGRFYQPEETTGEDAIALKPNGMVPSPTTETARPPHKLAVYERYLRVPHYLVYNRSNSQLRYFQLVGSRYQEQVLNESAPQLWLADIQVGLGIWNGYFEGMPGRWLRWCDHDGNWLLTDTELERQAKEAAQAQILQSARNLLATGMSLEQVTDLLNLTAEQVALLKPPT
ncbi:MAG: Uma2 family endonuclease, partial [Cyanobacteria bacterium J06639_14]